MDTFLVTSEIEYNEYMGETRRWEEVDIVEACSIEDAESIVEDHYRIDEGHGGSYQSACCLSTKRILRRK